MKVRVKDWGARYTTYYKWFEENDCTEYLEQYRQKESLIYDFECTEGKWIAFDKEGEEINTNNFIFEVVKRGNHHNFTDIELWLIEEPVTNKVMLFNKDALEVVE